MDLDRSVTYRGFDLNDVDLDAAGNLRGCQVHSADYSLVDASGYTERRANSDGLLANDIFLGRRQIALVGTVYGATRAEAHDRLQALCAALNPRLAYEADPASKGFLPLAFDIPTEDIGTGRFESGWRSVFIRARAAGSVAYRVARDSSAGSHYKGLGIPWSVNLLAIDPRIYVATRWQHDIPANFTGNSGSLPFANRGDYDSPLNMTLFIPAAKPAMEFWFEGAGTHFKVGIPNESADQTIRFDGDARIVTQQIGTVETLRMDLLVWDSDTMRAAVPPGDTTYAYELDGAGASFGSPSLSSIWFNEAFA